MASEEEQRNLALAVKDTVTGVVKNSSGKMAEFHEDTAAIGEQTSQALVDQDADLAGNIRGVNPDDQTPTLPGRQSSPTSPAAAGESGSPGTITDDFKGKGQNAQGGNPVNRNGSGGCNQVGEPVDVVGGQFVTTAVDVELPGLLPLVLRRAYASSFVAGGLFGPGWSSTLDIRVLIDGESVTLIDDDCRILDFPLPPPGQSRAAVHYSAAGPSLTLSWNRTTDTIRIEDRPQGWFYEFTTLGSETDRHGTVLRPLTAVSDRNGNRITIVRDQGLPVEVQHNGGYRVGVDTVYTPAGFRVEGLRLLDGAGAGDSVHGDTAAHEAVLLRYMYDPRGRLIGVTDSSGVPFGYDWDGQDRITAWIDRTGFEFSYEYDTAGRVIHTAGQDGFGSGEFAYAPESRVTRYTDSLGNTIDFHYDARGQVTMVVDALGAQTQAEYDQYGEVASRTDALGNRTAFTRDSEGRVTRIERPDGLCTTFEFGPDYQPMRVTRTDGAVWSFTYDERGNLTTETDPTGAVTRYERGTRGGARAVIDAAGERTVIESNPAGLVVASTDPLGNRTVSRRDAFGRVIEVIDPLGASTRYGWSLEGLPLWRVQPDDYRQERLYDAQGALIEESDSLGATTRYERGAFSSPRARITPDGSRLTFAYDTELRLTSVTNALGQVWSYRYDAAGNLASETDFSGRTLNYEHDLLGRLVGRVNGARERVEFVWDSVGRVVGQNAGEGRTVSFAYDSADRLVRAENSDAALELSYDAIGRVVAEGVDSRMLISAYDQLGRRIERRTPSGSSTTWTHDANHRVVTMSTAGTSMSFGYDGAGQESFRWIGDGTAVTNSWDVAGRRTATQVVAVEGPGEARSSRLLFEQVFTYRGDGLLAAVSDTVTGDRAYSLDVCGRVTAVNAGRWSESYAYDAAGQLVRSDHGSLDGAAPGENAGGDDGVRIVEAALLRQVGRTTYTYDDQGRLTRIARRTLSGQVRTWSFGYDFFDRLVEAANPAGERWRYLYDPLGRRIAKQRLNTDGVAVEETRFVWDDDTLVEELRVTSGEDLVTAVTWQYDVDGDAAVAQTERSYLASAPQEVIDERFFGIIANTIGAPTALITESGEVAWRQVTDLWGSIVLDEEPGMAYCPLRFPGQYHDRETGLYHNLHRYYDPRTARFTTPDPLGLTPSPDHYGYVENPLDQIDPLGLAGKKKGGSGGSRGSTPAPTPTPAPAPRAATQHIPAPSGNTLPGFPGSQRVRSKTPVQGGGGMRKRWEDKKHIYEWDSQHGEVEMYDKQGNHLGSFDPNTGKPITDKDGKVKGPVPGRKCVR